MDRLPGALHTVVCRKLLPLILQAPLNWVLISSVLTTTLVAQMAKNLPAVWETWVQSLGWEDSLEKEWQPTPVFLPGESHGPGSLAGDSPWGLRVRHNWVTNTLQGSQLEELILEARTAGHGPELIDSLGQPGHGAGKVKAGWIHPVDARHLSVLGSADAATGVNCWEHPCLCSTFPSIWWALIMCSHHQDPVDTAMSRRSLPLLTCRIVSGSDKCSLPSRPCTISLLSLPPVTALPNW